MLFRLTILLILFSLLISCQQESDPQPVYLELPIPKSYTIHKINNPLQIDGVASEIVWDLAEWTDFFIDIEGNKNPLPISILE